MKKTTSVILSALLIIQILGSVILISQRSKADPAINQTNGSWSDTFLDDNPSNSAQDGISSSTGIEAVSGDLRLKNIPWYNFSWNYRAPITIANASSGTLANYQVLLTIDTATLAGAGKMQTDGDDIRFTDFASSVVYDYWIESGINTATTKIWVKVPSLIIGTTIIQMYYGNSGATVISSFANTMENPPVVWWNQTFDGGSGITDQSFAITADFNRNVIVAGLSNSNFYTIKYDSNGNVLWSKSYDGGSTDQINGVAVDSSNNIVVTGYSSIDHSGRVDKDFYTIKYDSSGNVLWSKSYDGGYVDQANGVAVDGDNNIVVTGYSRTGTNDNFYTIKYDLDGNVVAGWPQTYDNTGIANGSDIASSVSVDSFDNIIVAGQSRNSTSAKDDFYTIKYNSSGTSLWEKRYNGAVHNRATGVATDSFNNVVVTGYNVTTISNNDFRTIKYDSSGNEIWNNLYSTADSDQANGIAIDNFNNIVLVSKNKSGTNFNYGISKYDSSGNIIWNTTYDSGGTPDSGQAVAIDNDNNILVTGYNATSDFYTIKYSEHKYADVVPTYLFEAELAKANSGTATSVDIIPTTLYGWTEFSWQDNEPVKTDIKYTLEAWNSTISSWDVPVLKDASNNSNGEFDKSSVDLSSLDYNVYTKARLRADLSTTDESTTPSVSEWQVTWDTQDNISPAITSVNSSHANGSFKAGEVIDITVAYDEVVNVVTTGGTPTLALNSNGSAIYNSGSGTNTLTFRYTAGAGQNSADLDYSATNSLVLNGGTIKDAAGNNADNTLPAVGTFAAAHAIVIDTSSPVISETTAVTTPANDSTPNYTFTADEAGAITYGGDCSSATALATIGANTITFSALADGAHSNCVITVTDVAGNPSNLLAVTAFTVDTSSPTIPVANIIGTTIQGAGDTVAITFGEPVIAVDGVWSSNEFTSIKSPSNKNLGLTNAIFNYADSVLTITLDEAIDDAYLKNGNVIAVKPANNAIKDIAGNSLSNAAVTGTTAIAGDAAAPTATLAYNPDRTVGDADTVIITAAFNEAIEENVSPTIAIDTQGNGDLSATNMTRTSNTIWTYNWNIPSGSDDSGIAAITITAADLAGNVNQTATNNTRIIDNTPPSDITDFIVSSAAADSITLAWTAPGGNGNTGTAASYDIRYATSDINNETKWNSATQAAGEPAPSAAGAAETIIITGLASETTYYFAIKTSDEIGNISGMSVSSGETLTLPDIIFPDPILNLSASNISNHTVKLNWTATGDDGNTGIAESYDIRYSTMEITNENWNEATQISNPSAPNPKIAGAEESVEVNGLSSGTTYYFAVKVSDEAHNTSGLSNILSVSLKYRLHLDIKDESNKVIENVKVRVYEGNNDKLPESEFESENDFKEVDIEAGEDNYIKYFLPLQQSLVIKDIVLTDNTAISPKFINSYNGVIPSLIEARSSVIALNDDDLSYDSAEITLSITGAANRILHCTDWDFDSAVCGNWEVKPLLDYSYSLNGNLLTLNVTRFDAYLAGYTDVTAPSAVSDLTTSNSTTNSLTLTWTAPGNDGNTGTANSYDIRYSTTAITDANWASAAQASGEPAPQIAGTSQSMTITNLSSSVTYYFAVKTSDAALNESAISNTASGATQSSGGSGGGGGGGYTPTTAVTNMSVSINNGAAATNNTAVTLTIGAANAAKMIISNSSDFSGGVWETYAISKSWTLTSGNGTKIVYIKFQDVAGYSSTVISDSITLTVSAVPATTYPDGTLLKTAESFKVYAIVSQKKKWISTPEVFETLGYKWGNIAVISKADLDKIPDYEDNLIRAIGDYKVHLVVNGIKRHIPNPEIFLDYGFGWGDVKDVPQSAIDKYSAGYLIRESRQGKIYYLDSRGIKKHIPSPEIFASYNNKWEDIQVISKKEMDSYPESNLAKLSGDNRIYLIERTTKRWIPSAEVFNAHRYDWNSIISINKAEFDYYKKGSAVK